MGSRSRIAAVLCAGLFAVTVGHASASGPRCAGGQSAGACAIGLTSGLLEHGNCDGATPPPQTPDRAQTAADRLQSLLDYIPCPDTGRVSFNTVDDHHGSMSVLDTLPSPAGDYMGVYHTEFRAPGAWFADFKVSLARSTDLIHWTRVAVLDPTGASMPTLSPVRGAPGYLLAYEKRLGSGGDFVRIRYYPSLSSLFANAYTAQRDVPRTFSPYNNGTPTILWVHWNGGLARSAIGLGFHYESAPDGVRGPDREAIGTLRGFRFWTARPDARTDAALDGQGLSGSHGDWRQFGFGGAAWRLYEAQTAFDDFGTWRVILQSQAAGRMYPLTLTMGNRPVSSSFANPVARVEPAPHGHGHVLVVTMFLFNARGAGAPGELVYYQPI